MKTQYPTTGMFETAPLPWKYDNRTRNVLAADGSIVCLNGDSVFGWSVIGEGIVKLANSTAGIEIGTLIEALQTKLSTTSITIGEAEQARRGELIARNLYLKRSIVDSTRWKTAWGAKTSQELFRILEEEVIL
jgi:hypothetical protein